MFFFAFTMLAWFRVSSCDINPHVNQYSGHRASCRALGVLSHASSVICELLMQDEISSKSTSYLLRILCPPPIRVYWNLLKRNHTTPLLPICHLLGNKLDWGCQNSCGQGERNDWTREEFAFVPNSTLSAHSTPSMREWSWLPTSYFQLPKRPRDQMSCSRSHGRASFRAASLFKCGVG